MSIESSFVAELEAHEGYSALCGDRTFPDAYDETEATPQTAYVQVSGRKDHTHSGPARSRFAWFQFAHYADTASQALAVQEQCISCLESVISRKMGGGAFVAWVKVSRGPSGWDPSSRKPFRITEARFFSR